MLFRVPSHPRHLISAVRQITPFVRSAAEGKKLKGGIYSIPELYPFMQKENKTYKDSLPQPWKEYGQLINLNSVKKRWKLLKGV